VSRSLTVIHFHELVVVFLYNLVFSILLVSIFRASPYLLPTLLRDSSTAINAETEGFIKIIEIAALTVII
jgi:hypothetical protein